VGRSGESVSQGERAQERGVASGYHGRGRGVREREGGVEGGGISHGWKKRDSVGGGGGEGRVGGVGAWGWVAERG
jgi:hypothetical protein